MAAPRANELPSIALHRKRDRVAEANTRAGRSIRMGAVINQSVRTRWFAWSRFRPWQLLLAIFLISLAANLLFGFLVRFRSEPGALEADELEYYDISSNLLKGHLTISARRTVGFPVALAAVRMLCGNFLLLQIVVTALYSLSPPLLAVAVRRVTRDWAPALIAGLAFAVWPPAIFYGTSLYSETLALPIFLGALALLPAAPDRRALPAIFAGLVLAIATHVRPMYLLFTPAILLIAMMEWRRIGPAIRTTLLVAVGYCIIILPWSAYVTAHFGRPILVSSNGGETLAGGLNPTLAEGTYNGSLINGRLVWSGPGKWLPPEQTGYLNAAELKLPYEQQGALLSTRTSAWIKGHPGQASGLEVSKIAYMWGGWPISRNGMQQLLGGTVPTLLLLALSIMLFFRKDTPRGALSRLWILPLFVSGVALISWGSWRFRMPGDAGLIGFAVAAAWQQISLRRGQARAG